MNTSRAVTYLVDIVQLVVMGVLSLVDIKASDTQIVITLEKRRGNESDTKFHCECCSASQSD